MTHTEQTNQQPKWMNRCYRIALAGLVIWLTAWAGYYFQNGEKLGYVITILTPVQLMTVPTEVVVCVLAAYNWNSWRDYRKRMITLCCSALVPVSLYMLLTLPKIL